MRFSLRAKQPAARTAEPTEAVADATRPLGLIVGLGNPGSQYAGNRHNVGFWTVNRLSRRMGITAEKHGKLASISEGSYGGRPLVLAKPRTFMNNSGDAVAELARRYKLRPDQVLIVYDDLDLPVGRVRLRARGSHGGNNGLKSIVARLGSQEFPRIRIGIGRPLAAGEPTWDPEHVANHVLSDPTRAERELLDAAVERVQEAILCILDVGIETAMNTFNRDPAVASSRAHPEV